MRKGIITGLTLLALAQPASAQESEPQALQITATNVTAVEAGREAPAGAALPGDVIEYRLVFTNVTDGTVSDVTFTDPIPEGLAFVMGSATVDREDVAIDFSVNGGETWSAEPMIDVVEPDGRIVRRPAPASAYTHVRWTVQGAVATGAQVTARFRAQVVRPGEEVAG